MWVTSRVKWLTKNEDTPAAKWIIILEKIFFLLIFSKKKDEFSRRLGRQNEWYLRQKIGFYFKEKKGKDC